ncbi:MAG TPA: hypothetical protein VEL76_38290 [Gemmataceae bacterium]|nr:hypothetical protein [Gemmataceae bacterium]
MSIIICPSCGTKLRLNNPLPPGRQVRCPKCAVAFTPGEDEPVTAVRPHATPAPLPRPEPVPRRRPAVPDDEDFDDRPKRKRPRKEQGSNLALILSLSIGGGLLVIGLVVLIIVLSSSGSSKQPEVVVKGGVPQPKGQQPPFPVPQGGGAAFAQNEALARDMIAILNEMADALESVRDKNTARVAAARLQQVCNRMENLVQRVAGVPKLTPEEDLRLQQQFNTQLMQAQIRMQRVAAQAGQNSQGEPSFQAAALRMQQVGMRMQQMGR